MVTQVCLLPDEELGEMEGCLSRVEEEEVDDSLECCVDAPCLVPDWHYLLQKARTWMLLAKELRD